MAEENVTEEKSDLRTAVHSAYFYIPNISLFNEGNPYILSENTFNCKIEPCDEGLKATLWYGMKCFELSEHEAEHTAEKNDAGLEEIVDFLDRGYEDYKRKIESGEVRGRRTYKPSGN